MKRVVAVLVKLALFFSTILSVFNNGLDPFLARGPLDISLLLGMLCIQLLIITYMGCGRFKGGRVRDDKGIKFFQSTLPTMLKIFLRSIRGTFKMKMSPDFFPPKMYYRRKEVKWSTLYMMLSVTVVVFLIMAGLCAKGYVLNAIVIVAFVGTAIFIVLHVHGILKRSKLPWHWIECIFRLVMGILLVISASVVLSVLTRSYIVIGVTAYLLATIYFVDTFNKYQWAITPTPKYAWTTPNMPDLN